MSTSQITNNMNMAMTSTTTSASSSSPRYGIKPENRPAMSVPSLPGARLITISVMMAALATLFLLAVNSLFGASAETVLIMISGLTGVLYLAQAMNASSKSQLLVDVTLGLGLMSVALIAQTTAGSLLIAAFLINSLWAAFQFTQKHDNPRTLVLYTGWFSFNMALALILLLSQAS